MRQVLFVLIVTCALAQADVDIRRVSGRASDRLKEAERRWRTAQQRSWRDPISPEELAVVAAVTKIYSELFQPELRSAPRIATLTEKGQDILLARWTLSGDKNRISDLIVWDTPQGTSFIFRLAPGSWSVDPAIRSSFERLLLPPRSDGETPPAKGATVNIARDPYTKHWVGAGGILMNYGPRQFDVGLMNWFDLWETNAASFLAVTFSQFATPGFPSNMRSIGERFPSLESRVGQWSKEQLLNELAHSGGFESSGRDRVMAKELLRRNLTDDELVSLLKTREPDPSGSVLSIIVEVHQVTRFMSAIRTYLQTATGNEGKANHPFDILGPTDEENFTDVAIEVLRHDYRANPAFRYAARHGATLAEYRALTELPLLDVSYVREGYLSQMRRRLGLVTDGNPKLLK